MMRRRPEVETRARERRIREDSAPRLRDQVPTLATLSISLHERSSRELVATTPYVRHVVVRHAPALFEFPCSETDCENGGHDLTGVIAEALHAGQVHFAGEHMCRGSRKGNSCDRVLVFDAQATFSSEGSAAPDTEKAAQKGKASGDSGQKVASGRARRR